MTVVKFIAAGSSHQSSARNHHSGKGTLFSLYSA
jgi:hypothetical protein